MFKKPSSDDWNATAACRPYLDPLRGFVDDGDGDVGTLFSNHGAGGTTHIAGTQAADLGHGHDDDICC